MQFFNHSRRVCVLFASIAALGLLRQSGQAREAEWLSLLGDKNISDRWETKGSWRVDGQGAVILEPRKGETGWRRFGDYLWSKDKFKDFELEFEYRLNKKGNSGFYFHVGDKTNPVKTGVEVQIFDSFGARDRSKLTDHDSGGIIPGIPPEKNSSRPAGEWNEVRIRVDRDTVKIWLNDQLVNEVKLDHPNISDRPGEGYVGFQDHGMPLLLRNVRIRIL